MKPARDLPVADVMTHLVVTLKPTDTLHEAAQRLACHNVSGAPVVVHGKVEGIISESDIVRAISDTTKRRTSLSILDWIGNRTERTGRAADGKLVVDVMSPIVLVITPDRSVWDAAQVMAQRGVNRLPVVDDEDYLIGIITRGDLVRAVARDQIPVAGDSESEAVLPTR
ncbi:MAG: CBS domain-containing protein [Actinobacteria bacterium]|nr:CBS domain-containing protein [Actinomycetota bacterium]